MPVEADTDIPVPATFDVTPELVIARAPPSTKEVEPQDTPEEQVTLEVETPLMRAGVPLVVVNMASWPAVALEEVPTLLLKIWKLAADRYPSVVRPD